MSEKKSIRGTLSSKAKETTNDHLYVPDDHLLIIYHAQFYQQLLLLCLKHTILICDIKTATIIKQHRATTHTASFLPNTPYVAFANRNGEGKYTVLEVWNYESNSIDTKITLNFQIQSLKASRHCLIMSSLLSLYVLHFPTLKPIYNGKAGNGFNIVYDISREGLTVVHSTQIKGEVFVRNFTNSQTNHYLNAIRTTSNQISQKIKRRSTRRVDRSFVEPEEEPIKTEIRIKAHHQSISILRLSPNGYRFVSGSTKGTVLRLYSCLNGELMSQFHACNGLSTIVDINFIPQGNAIVCLNEQNHVKLFHTKMSQEELICQSVRRGKEVYEQDNPKSWFSFLGFLNEELKYEKPFSYFNLENLSTKDVPKQSVLVKATHNLGMSEIKEQSHESQLIAAQEEEAESGSMQREVYVEEVNINEIINTTIPNQSEKTSSMRSSNNNSESELKTSRNKSVRISNTLHKKRNQNASLKSLVKKQSEIFMMSRQKNLNFRGIIMFQNHINVKVFKGKYYYEFKYDPFNGGEMMSKQPKINLLDICTH